MKKKPVINERVTIEGDVKVAKNVIINVGTTIYGPVEIKEGTYIGENVIIGHFQQNVIRKLVKFNNKNQDSANNYFTQKSDVLENKPKTMIGKNVIIRSGTIIYSEVEIGDDVNFGHNVLVREKTTIGNSTVVGTNTIIEGNVVIGSNCSIQSQVFIPLYSTIEDNVFLGPNCKLTNDKYVMRKEYPLKGPKIKHHVSIGANAVIMPDITIGENAIIGAGSVVTHYVPDGSIVFGVPAREYKNIRDGW